MSIVGALRIAHTQPWVEQALCAQVDAEIFFPPKGGSAQPAKQVCAMCPVRAECLKCALKNGEIDGIWGGMTPTERKRLARGLKLRRPKDVCTKGHDLTVHGRSGRWCRVCRRNWEGQRRMRRRYA